MQEIPLSRLGQDDDIPRVALDLSEEENKDYAGKGLFCHLICQLSHTSAVLCYYTSQFILHDRGRPIEMIRI